MACFKCGKAKQFALNPDFSTWQDFGQLWEWAIKQEWWFQFKISLKYIPEKHELYGVVDVEKYISPDKFADALYEYLKEVK